MKEKKLKKMMLKNDTNKMQETIRWEENKRIKKMVEKRAERRND